MQVPQALGRNEAERNKALDEMKDKGPCVLHARVCVLCVCLSVCVYVFVCVCVCLHVCVHVCVLKK